MPISFAPASPLGTSGIPYQYGKLQQQSSNAQRQQAAYEFSVRAGQQNAELQLQASAQNQRAAEFDASQQPSQRDMYLNDQHASQSQNNINSQIQGQMAENQQRFTQADNLRLQKLQAGRAAVMSDTSLTPEERQQVMPYIDGETSALEARRMFERDRLDRQNEMRIAQTSAAAAARARADEKHLAQGGPEMSYQRDPNTGEMQTYYRSGGRNSQWTMVPPSGGRGAAASGGSASAATGVPTPDITRIISDVRGATTRNAAGEQVPQFPTEEAVQAEVAQRFRSNQEIVDTLQPQIQGHREMQPRGPIPGGMPQAQIDPATGKVLSPLTRVNTDTLIPSIGQGIIHAESINDPAMSRDLRGAALALQSGKDTGQLNEQQQARLRQIGYYGGEFTPQVDSDLSAPQYERVQNTTTVSRRAWHGFGLTEEQAPTGTSEARRLPPDPRAQQIRTWLSQYKSVANMPPDIRARFTALRTGMVLAGSLPASYTNWPPEAPRDATQPTAPTTGNSPSMRNDLGDGPGPMDYSAAPGV